MHINKTINAIFADLMESQHAISDNPGRGYHGTIDPEVHVKKGKDGKKPEGNAHHDKLYAAMHKRVREATGAHPKEVKHYLDSTHGRHLADVHNDTARRKLTDNHVTNYIKGDFAKFKKHYKPAMFESIMDDGSIEFETMDDVDQIDERMQHGEDAAQLHKVAVKYTEGAGPKERHVIVRAKSKDSAAMKAASQVAKSSGIEVLSAVHHSIVEQAQLDEISTELRTRYAAAARKDADDRHEEGKRAEKRGHYVYSAAQHEKARMRDASAYKQEKKLGLKEEERFNHRTAATKGVMHPDHTKYAKVGEHSDFYSSKDGDKLYGKCTKNDGKEVHFQHGGKTHKFKVAKSYEGLHEDELVEWPTDQAKPKVGDRVIVKAPGSPHNNKRGTYGGMERGRHVVKHGDGTRSIHGDGAVLKEEFSVRHKDDAKAAAERAKMHKEGTSGYHYHMSQHHDAMATYHEANDRRDEAAKHEKEHDEHWAKHLKAKGNIEEDTQLDEAVSIHTKGDGIRPTDTEQLVGKRVGTAKHGGAIYAGKVHYHKQGYASQTGSGHHVWVTDKEHTKVIASHHTRDEATHHMAIKHAKKAEHFWSDREPHKDFYLHHHTHSQKMITKKGTIKEDVDQLDELSKATLRNYTIDASNKIGHHSTERAIAFQRGDHAAAEKHDRKDRKRRVGIVKAAFKLAKEDVNESTKSADKKPIVARTATGKLITKMVTRKQDVVDAGGKDPDDETANS